MTKNDEKNYIYKLKNVHENSLILNPTENIPFNNNISLDFLEGMYIPEEVRSIDNKVIFAGRENLNQYYSNWCSFLNAAQVTFKPHSGLDAHISIFMALGKIGEKILLLPEIAGGHFSTYNILKRLGFEIKEFPIMAEKYCIDIDATKKIIEDWKPNYYFIDRSEGLYYEDFSWLNQYPGIKIFDASQYLTNIMAKHYKNPFDMGFDIILTSLHKNYPGPQKAAIFFKENNDICVNVLKELSIYISNIHPKDICSVLINLPLENDIKKYSQQMLEATKVLEQALLYNGIPVVARNFEQVYTQHIWIKTESKNNAYTLFKKLEELNILTNYRLLPYNLGYGLRLGTAGAIRQGLELDHIKPLSRIISDVYYQRGDEYTLKNDASELIFNIKRRK